VPQAVYDVEMQMRSVGVPGVPQAAEKLAAPDSLSSPDGHAALLKVNVMNESASSEIEHDVVSTDGR
jgi:hypothetical protein